MAIRVRQSVWSLPPGDPIITWYRRAVDELIKRDRSDPSSWIYLAAVHGFPKDKPKPPDVGPYWDQCQHASWFFLPWHRGYVASFEAVVARTIVQLGGPDEWALPYWDYSEDLASNPKARLMPPDFRDRLLPDGKPNALWSTRARVQNGDFKLEDGVVKLDALKRKTRSFFDATKRTPQHVYLSLENVTGAGVPGDFEVYIDMPDDDEAPVLVGVMTTFGIERASDPDRGHGGSGFNQVFEITDVAERLGLTRETVSRLQ